MKDKRRGAKYRSRCAELGVFMGFLRKQTAYCGIALLSINKPISGAVSFSPLF
jgi:hypothetical protein